MEFLIGTNRNSIANMSIKPSTYLGLDTIKLNIIVVIIIITVNIINVFNIVS